MLPRTMRVAIRPRGPLHAAFPPAMAVQIPRQERHLWRPAVRLALVLLVYNNDQDKIAY